MDRHDEDELNADARDLHGSSTAGDGDTHATTGGAAAAGAVTGGVIGLAGGPIGAAIGAVGGAIVGAAAERMMHSDDDAERAEAGLDNDHDSNPLIENRAEADARSTGVPNMSAAAMDTRTPGTETWTPTAQPSVDTTATTAANVDTHSTGVDTHTTGDRIQLREEQLQARTTPVETGQVSIGKEIVEEQRSIDVPVTREEAFIERTTVDRRPSDQPIGRTEQTVDVPVYEERATAEKRPVVYEEVGIGKRQVSETQQVSETVRREEARVDTEGTTNIRDTDDRV